MSEAQGLVLPDRGVIAVAGQDARPFLQGLITNDVAKLSPQRAIYAALLTPQGKLLFDFFVAECDDVLLLDVERARADALCRRLSLYRLRARVTVEDLSDLWAVAAVWGADAARRLDLAPEPGRALELFDGSAFVDPRQPAMGVRILAPAAGLDESLRGAGFAPAALEDYDRLRLIHGLPDGSRDLPPEQTFLLENNFEALNGVDFRKGCYVGQEVTARTKHRGTLKKRLVPVAVEGTLPPPGTPIMAGGREVGVLRSGQGSRALALLRREAIEAEADAPLLAGTARLVPIHDHPLARAS